jgi:hypothetical protein
VIIGFAPKAGRHDELHDGRNSSEMPFPGICGCYVLCWSKTLVIPQIAPSKSRFRTRCLRKELP